MEDEKRWHDVPGSYSMKNTGQLVYIQPDGSFKALLDLGNHDTMDQAKLAIDLIERLIERNIVKFLIEEA